MGLKQVPVETSARCSSKQINWLLLEQNLLHYSGFRGEKGLFSLFLLDGSVAKRGRLQTAASCRVCSPVSFANLSFGKAAAPGGNVGTTEKNPFICGRVASISTIVAVVLVTGTAFPLIKRLLKQRRSSGGTKS